MGLFEILFLSFDCPLSVWGCMQLDFLEQKSGGGQNTSFAFWDCPKVRSFLSPGRDFFNQNPLTVLFRREESKKNEEIPQRIKQVQIRQRLESVRRQVSTL